MRILVLVLLFGSFGSVRDAVKNVCENWLDYTPWCLRFTVTTEPNIVNHYKLQLSANHIDGGWGVVFPDPCTYIRFLRFNWEKDEGVVFATNVEMTVLVHLEQNEPWLRQDYNLDIEDDKIIYVDPLGRETTIQFLKIEWRRINLFMFAEAARRNR